MYLEATLRTADGDVLACWSTRDLPHTWAEGQTWVGVWRMRRQWTLRLRRAAGTSLWDPIRRWGLVRPRRTVDLAPGSVATWAPFNGLRVRVTRLGEDRYGLEAWRRPAAGETAYAYLALGVPGGGGGRSRPDAEANRATIEAHADRAAVEAFWADSDDPEVAADGAQWLVLDRNRLNTELAAARQELRELRALFDLQWRRMGEATQMWRAERPEERALTLPDLGDLLGWLMGEARVGYGWRDRHALDTSRYERELTALRGRLADAEGGRST